MDYDTANIFFIRTKLKTEWFWLHLPVIIFRVISAINFRSFIFIVVGRSCQKRFCFGYIANNDWKIYSIEVVSKALATIHFYSLLTFTN